MMDQPDWGSSIAVSPDTPSVDQATSDGVMIALVPTNTSWCQINCPHLTLVYVGKTEDLNPTMFNELGKITSDLAVMNRPISLRVTGTEEFGGDSADNPPVEVFTLESTAELRALRRAVESWNASEWPFNPHVTIGPRGTIVDIPPTALTFDKLMVKWGDQELVFSLTNF